MRILAAADIHGVAKVYEWLVQSAESCKPDLLVLAGDLFAGGWAEEQREQARTAIIPLLKQVSVPVFYIMGNDDNVALDYEDQRIKPLHRRRIEMGGYEFLGYQYTPPFVGVTFVKPESEIEEDLRSLEMLLDPRTVLITHAPAHGTLDSSLADEHVGSRALAALLDRRPVLAHIHGHIHGCFGRDGNRFNVAAAGQRRAYLIELPSLRARVLRED